MTECNECGCHNWHEITIWQCDSCRSLCGDENGTEYQNKLSSSLLATIESQGEKIKRLKEAFGEIEQRSKYADDMDDGLFIKCKLMEVYEIAQAAQDKVG